MRESTPRSDPSKASREEAIWHEAGLLSVAGGKLTTWRRMAEETVDAALRHLPAERARRAAPCATAGTPLAGLAPADLDEQGVSTGMNAFPVQTQMPAQDITGQNAARAIAERELANQIGRDVGRLFFDWRRPQPGAELGER